MTVTNKTVYIDFIEMANDILDYVNKTGSTIESDDELENLKFGFKLCDNKKFVISLTSIKYLYPKYENIINMLKSVEGRKQIAKSFSNKEKFW